MGQAIGNTLPMAIGVAISPVPIIAIVLMLGTPRARANGPAFAVGWLAGLSIIGAITLVAASGNHVRRGGEPATWANVLKLVFGLLFVLDCARTWHGRPKPGEEAADAQVDAGDRRVHRSEIARGGRASLGLEPEEPRTDGCRRDGDRANRDLRQPGSGSRSSCSSSSVR